MGPKKPGSSGGSGSKGASAVAEDDVTVKGKDKKGANKNVQPPATGAAKGKGKAAAPAPAAPPGKGKSVQPPTANQGAGAAPAAPERPTMYDLSKWTGKTPITLLHELCQKKKWLKPQYFTNQSKEGLTVRCCIARKDKSGEVMTRSYMAPEPCPTAADAKLRTAVFTLHGINSHLSMTMAFPPALRDYWNELNQTHKDAHTLPVPGDPFESKAPNTVEFKKKMEAIGREAAPEPAPPPVEKKRELSNKLAQVHMSADVRQFVEDVIRSVPYLGVSRDDDSALSDLFTGSVVGDSEGSAEAKKRQLQRTIDAIVRMGFRKAHVEEAATLHKDKGGMLDWLCMNVPEDDLPPKFKPMRHDVIAKFTHDPTSLAEKYAVDRLHAVGFDRDACAMALQATAFDEPAALRRLVDSLVSVGDGDWESMADADMAVELTDAEAREQREDEYTALKSMFGDDVIRTDQNGMVAVTFNRGPAEGTDPKPAGGRGRGRGRGRLGMPAPAPAGLRLRGVDGETRLEVMYGKAPVKYPAESPTVLLRNERLPAYIRLSAMQMLNRHARELSGHPVIHALVGWVETELANLIANPPPLSQTRVVTATLPSAAQNAHVPAEALRTDDSKDQSAPPPRQSRTRERSSRPMAPPSFKRPISNKASAPMLDKRASLPAHVYARRIAEMIDKNQVLVVSGETGCGKSTQVPQFILDLIGDRERPCNVIVTQPRRLSAIAVADRVAAERGEKIGDTVGYSIRLETKKSPETRLLFCTTGILLRRLQTDRALEGVTHVIIDEVHERSLDSDILIVILREVLQKRPDFRLVLMSATLDAGLFSSYFNGAPSVDIPGRTKPVTNHYLEDIIDMLPSLPAPQQRGRRRGKDDDDDPDWERAASSYSQQGYKDSTILALREREKDGEIDYELCAHLVKHISEERELGAILIFIPGIMEIRKACETIERVGSDTEKLLVLPLHSSLSADEQNRIFATPPKGTRKVVVATNIAETSITIDDVVHVIDSGRAKEMQYDAQSNMAMLVEGWASKASAKQRMGRAGRVRAGHCYKLYTRKRFDSLPDQSPPEIVRVPLQQLCLSIKAMGIHDVNTFLQRALTPPDIGNVRSALAELRAIRALDPDEHITPLGRHLAELPVDVKIAKFILYGAIFRCVDPVLTIAACLSYRSPFYSPMDKRDEAKAAMMRFAVGKSDLLTVLRAYEGWREARKAGRGSERLYLEENFLSFQTLNQIHELRKQFLDALVSIGFIDRAAVKGQKHTIKVESDAVATIRLMQAVICAGLYPNIVRIVHPKEQYQAVHGGVVAAEHDSKDIRFFDQTGERMFVHPSSVNFGTTKYEHLFGAYSQKVKTSKVFIRDVTMVSTWAILLFGGEIDVDHERQRVTIDKWLWLDAPARIGVLANELRKRLDALLETKIERPDADISSSPVVEAILRLINTDGI